MSVLAALPWAARIALAVVALIILGCACEAVTEGLREITRRRWHG